MENSIVHFVNQILIDAIRCDASDIHIEPYETQCRLRYRQDGLLRTVSDLKNETAQCVISRIKVLSNLDISERRLPQDGRFKLTLSPERHIDFRVSTCPMLYGEKLVLRALKSARDLPDISALGMTSLQCDQFLSSISQSQGLILVCGATGSGKTMTLYTALQKLNSEEKNISSVEDPIEIPLYGINQVAVNTKTGLSFSTALRAFLRQDPDVMMVGEVRDIETAEMAVKAAQTGHLVLTTLHTNSSTEAMMRLVNLGISSVNLASCLVLVIAQRLIRKVCDHCKKIENYPESLLLKLGFEKTEIATLTLYRAVGCERCYLGYQGRIGVFEVLPISKKMSQAILEGRDAIYLAELAQQENAWTMHQACLQKIREGMTTLEELHH